MGRAGAGAEEKKKPKTLSRRPASKRPGQPRTHARRGEAPGRRGPGCVGCAAPRPHWMTGCRKCEPGRARMRARGWGEITSASGFPASQYFLTLSGGRGGPAGPQRCAGSEGAWLAVGSCPRTLWVFLLVCGCRSQRASRISRQRTPFPPSSYKSIHSFTVGRLRLAQRVRGILMSQFAS